MRRILLLKSGIMHTIIRRIGPAFVYLFASIAGSLQAQSFHAALQLRNSHLWRGLEVATGLVYTGNLELSGENFYGGSWAGGDATGDYKEFNHYVGYRSVKNRLRVELWDIYNFSPGATYNNSEYFNYKASETGRFWDFRSFYTISEAIPLELSWNAVVFGRDRNQDNSGNKYSYFASVEYPFLRRADLNVNGRIGYADALRSMGERNNFFASRNGLSEISLIITKQLSVASWQVPVGFWLMWNTVDQNAFLQFSVQLFSF